MAVEQEKQPAEEIKKLKQFVPKEKQEDLAKILAYWEKMKLEWERKKIEFWKKHNRDDFLNLLSYRIKYIKKLEWKYEYLNYLKWLERKKFIKEYLYDNILYSGEFDKSYRIIFNNYRYEDLENWPLNFSAWDNFSWCYNNIWTSELEEIINSLKMVEWVKLNFSQSRIWVDWVKYIVNNLQLKEWVALDLYTDELWVEWAEAISHIK